MTSTNSHLRATPGDRAVIRGHHVGEPEQDAEILETLGDDGAPPFLVRWEDGHTSRLYPGSDVYVQHFEHPGEPRRDGEPSRELSELR